MFLEQTQVKNALEAQLKKLEIALLHNPSDIRVIDYTVLAALDRQKPKAVKEAHIIPNTSYHAGFCPNCDMRIIKMAGEIYCSHCGQRLEWEKKKPLPAATEQEHIKITTYIISQKGSD